MISGVVNPGREAVISLEIQDRSGHRRRFEAVIDTGFTDCLTLPGSMIEPLDLQADGATRVALAGDVAGYANVYLAEIIWENHPRTIPVLELSGVPLVGMSLLVGRHLHIHVIEGGSVSIR